MSTWECHYSRSRYTKSPSTRGAWQRWPQATHCWFLSGFRLLGCWLNLSQNKQLDDALGAVFVVIVFNLHKILLLYMFRMKLSLENNDQLLLKLEMLFSWDKKVIWAQNLLFLFFCGNDSVRVFQKWKTVHVQPSSPIYQYTAIYGYANTMWITASLGHESWLLLLCCWVPSILPMESFVLQLTEQK